MSAIVHLSRKYDSPHLYCSAIAWLERHFTPDVAHFDVRMPPGFLDSGAIGVLNLARVIGSPSLLCGAIFACCRLSLDDLVNGYIRDDRGKETLSLEDLVRVRMTRDRLVGACIISATFVYASKGVSTCRRRGCRDALDRIRHTTVRTLRAVTPSQPMRFPMLQRSARETADVGLCDTCVNMLETREREAREELWSLLPCIADEVVPGWAGKCLKHCPDSEASEQSSDSGSDSEDLEECCIEGPIHDWMRYKRTCC